LINPISFFYDLTKTALLISCLFLGYLIQIASGVEDVCEYNGKVLFFKTVLYGPFMEEMIYRFIVFEIIRQRGYDNTYSNIVASLIFGFSK